MLTFSEPVDSDPTNSRSGYEIGLTAERSPLFDLIDGLQAGGGTQLYNVAAKAVRYFPDGGSAHRVVLLLSDGKNDSPENGDLGEAVRLAHAARVPFFVIGLGQEIDEPYLRSLAQETGGLYRSAPTSDELVRLYGDMAALLKTRYRLSYTSGLPGDGRAGSVSVRMDVQGAASISNPTQEPIATPMPLAQTPVIAPTAAPPARPNWGWYGAGAVLAIVLTGGLFLRRKPRPTPEACARCGYDLSGKGGPYPECGESKRLRKRS